MRLQHLRAGGRDAAGHIEEVLPRDRQAVEQAERASRPEAFRGGLGIPRRALRCQFDEDGIVAVCVDRRIGLLGEVHGVQLAALHQHGKAGECLLFCHVILRGMLFLPAAAVRYVYNIAALGVFHASLRRGA
ncbi:hypothetical protein D3C86_1703790 [compost metagenome]